MLGRPRRVSTGGRRRYPRTITKSCQDSTTSLAEIKSAAGLVLVLTIWGISQAALFTVSHTRVMNATESTPALEASLNISGANLGIALGAIVGGRMIDLFGLASVSAAAAAIVAVAIAAAAFLMVIGSPKAQTCEECGSAIE